MGLYDTVRSRFPLPHHQDAEYQTKDIEHLVSGVSDLGGTLSEYEITPDGGLRVRVHSGSGTRILMHLPVVISSR